MLTDKAITLLSISYVSAGLQSAVSPVQLQPYGQLKQKSISIIPFLINGLVHHYLYESIYSSRGS